jgi:uncharacterized protein YdeI (BOF family)
MRSSITAVASICLLTLAVSPVLAADQGAAKQQNQAVQSTAPQPTAAHPMADQRQIKRAANGEWIQVSGTVKSVSPKQFTLDYGKGKGQIVIETDPSKFNAEKALKVGDKVIATGRMDKDFFETKELEASSIYVPRLRHFFYANPADEEDGYVFPIVTFAWDRAGNDRNWFTLTGTITSIDDNEMKVDTGFHTIQVDTGHVFADRAGVDPLERIAHVGERVAVSGWLDDAEVFDAPEIQATSLVVLTKSAI